MLNKKGTVLVVAVTAMMIMIIIGAICLQIYTNQSLIDTYDQIKMRTYYSAEGAIELMRGYIVQKTSENLVTTGTDRGDSTYYCRGFLASVTKITGHNTTANWEPFKSGSSYYVPLLEGNFDGTIYPGIKAEVYLHRLTKNDKTRLQNEKIVFRDNSPGVPADIEQYIYANVPNEASDTSDYRGYEIVAVASTTYKTSLSIALIETKLRYYFYTRRVKTDIGSGNYNYTNEIKWVAWRRD